jgi:hypothetical protein
MVNLALVGIWLVIAVANGRMHAKLVAGPDQ